MHPRGQKRLAKTLGPERPAPNFGMSGWVGGVVRGVCVCVLGERWGVWGTPWELMRGSPKQVGGGEKVWGDEMVG